MNVRVDIDIAIPAANVDNDYALGLADGTNAIFASVRQALPMGVVDELWWQIGDNDGGITAFSVNSLDTPPQLFTDAPQTTVLVTNDFVRASPFTLEFAVVSPSRPAEDKPTPLQTNTVCTLDLSNNEGQTHSYSESCTMAPLDGLDLVIVGNRR